MKQREENRSMTEFSIATTVKHMCDDLDIGLTTGWKLIREGKVKAIRIGRRTLVLRSSIDELISSK